ncbi:MAG: site-specific integrase [Lachnospiraceae bacterium]|nr:site-specific integrase [Lachnospiraceae bacterium]
MLDAEELENQIQKMKRQEILANHDHKIYQSAGKWFTYVSGGEKGRILVKRNTKEAIEDAVVEFYRKREYNPSFNELFKEWNDRQIAIGKIIPATHARNQQIYARHFTKFGKKRIKTLTPADLEDFLENQIGKFDMSAKSFSNLKSIVRGVLRMAKRKELINFSIEAMLEDLDINSHSFRQTIKEDYQEVFNDDEMEKIVSYLKGNQDKWNLGILLLFVTGMRVGELCTLKHEDIEDDSVKIRRTETKYLSSNGKWIQDVKEFPKTRAGFRTIVLPENYVWLLDELQKLNPDGEYLFVNDEGERLHIRSFDHRLRKINEKLGIYNKSCHKIRKTYGSILLDNHVDQQMIKDQMGHTNIRTTETYYHRNRKSLDRKGKIISSIPEFCL